jgi:hypothetical protein
MVLPSPPTVKYAHHVVATNACHIATQTKQRHEHCPSAGTIENRLVSAGFDSNQRRVSPNHTTGALEH